MHETILNKYATNQISYYVEDMEAFACQHMALFGSGPFFYMPPLPTRCNYHGKEIEFIMQTAFGQFGNLQIELVQVTVEPGTPNPYAELGHYGFHHLSNWVDDFDGAMKIFADAGYEPLFTMESGNGMRIAYIDLTETLGHYLEMHMPIKQIWDIYAAAARDWDGVTDPWRPFAFPSA